MSQIFIAGATGQQGGATARTLLAQGHRIHAYVRSAHSPSAQALQTLGAVLFEGDWDRIPNLRAAMSGCVAVFFPSMPSFTDPDAEPRWAGNLLRAARDVVEAAGFEVKAVDVLGVHYSATIFRWYQNWVSNKDKVVAAYGERWYRIWVFFLAWSVIISR